MESSQPVADRGKGGSASPFAVVCSFWSDFDLEKERSGLDEQGLKIAENQENSQKNRRKLAESTRGMQSLQKVLGEQDQKLSELESENRKMKLELEEYRSEAAHLKNQQATIRRLEELVGIHLFTYADFDLEKERSGLDEQGLKIAENQGNSQKNRRKLAESTRDFKKASADEKLNLFNSLLKAYQEEVDNLTKRAKFGENAFLNIYQKLYEAPDPYPALASIDEQDQKSSELESENRKMKLELEEYRSEAAHLKNQQATIRRLEERNRQLEQQMEEKVREIVEIKQRSLAEENQKTLEVLKEREYLLQDQLRQAKESVMNMQKLHEFAQSQMFELRAQSEEERAAKQAEVNLLMDEVE